MANNQTPWDAGMWNVGYWNEGYWTTRLSGMAGQAAFDAPDDNTEIRDVEDTFGDPIEIGTNAGLDGPP
jgi:hypothetical protein